MLPERSLGGPRLPWLAVTLLVLLLVLLAGLQLRWLGRVADAERQRLEAAAEDALLALAHEVDTEVSRAWLTFRRAASDGDPRQRVVALRDAWLAAAPHPELVAAWVLVALDAAPEGAAVALTRDGDAWEPLAGDLASRVARLLPPPEGRWGGLDGRRPGGGPGPVRPELPGLLVPLDRGGDHHGHRRRGPQAVLLVVFDEDELRERFLPGLVARHASRLAGRGLEARVRVAGAPGGGEVVWSSPPGASGPFEWQTPLFDLLPADELARLAFTMGDLARPVDGRERFEDLSPPGRRAALAALLVRRPGWVLEARPAAGSLDAAVARARRGNAALGFGILLLLALAVTALLVSTRRAQEMARRQLEFTAAVSHELRTPLAAIRSLGDNLADGVVREGEQARRYGVEIARQSARLGSLVEQVLALAAQEAAPAARRPVDLARVVREAVAEETASAGGHVAVDVPEPAPPLTGDAEMLRRAVGNLVGNALKHGAPPVTVRVVPAGDAEVRLEVADRGPGIAAGERERLFEPFFRGRRAQGEQVPGVGLGLHLVRRVAEAHGGRVEVASAEATRGGAAPGGRAAPAPPAAPGGGAAGSRFTLVLPRGAEPA